jgi:DNA-binding CsgD family transcriptional regulator
VWIGHAGRPAASSPLVEQALERAVAAAVAAGQGRGTAASGSIVVARGASPAPLAVSVYPLSRLESVAGVAAAVFISDKSGGGWIPEVVGAVYGFTKAEVNLATHLIRGGDLASYCLENGVSSNTGKTHLKRLFIKTDTHRQGELVSTLLGVANRSAGAIRKRGAGS